MSLQVNHSHVLQPRAPVTIHLSFLRMAGKTFAKQLHLSPFEFDMSHIVAYFVSQSVTNGKVAGDLKPISKSAENLFICGHVQNIQCVEVDRIIYVKTKCPPEMRKDRVYLLKVAIKSEVSDIGMGPKGNCKLIAALAYPLVNGMEQTSSKEFRYHPSGCIGISSKIVNIICEIVWIRSCV